MSHRRAGFSLLEVSIALLVVTVGVLGLQSTLGPVTALAGQGRLRGRAATVLESRLDRLRAQVYRQAGCAAPSGGNELHPDGILETWTASAAGGLVSVEIVARSGGTTLSSDTLSTLLACP
jgi:type IV pilus assembly protein PilV